MMCFAINRIEANEVHKEYLSFNKGGSHMNCYTVCKIRIIASLIVCGCLIARAERAVANAVTDWNEISVPRVFQGRPGGAIGFVDLALVQAAVHDAVQAIEGQFEPYHVKISGASGSPAAAVAAAAYSVLVGFYPEQAVDLTATYQTYLSKNNLVNDPGLAVGQTVAAGIIPLRRLDPSPLPADFNGGTNPGEWRPTPPSFAPMAFPWLGAFQPFTLKSPTQYRAPKPPVLHSARYAHEYDEVKALGGLLNGARTAEQTDLAYFFAGNLVAILYQGLRDIATQQGLSISESARLLALCSLAIGDSVITAWDSKLYYIRWRPVTAIREGDNDENRHTVGDPTWEPFLDTPPYPDYTSGANNVYGSATRMLELFFGTDELTFSLTTDNTSAIQKTRTYTRFSDLAQDVVDVRIYQGIHTRSADAAARKQGGQVAKWAFKHFLQPVNGDHDGDDEEKKDHEKDHDDDRDRGD
jgi:hypothetical protein